MQRLTENHILWRVLPVKRSYLLLLLEFQFCLRCRKQVGNTFILGKTMH